MRRPNFRKAVRNNKCSGKMFAQAYPRPSGIKTIWHYNYCVLCEGCTLIYCSTDLCEHCTNNPENIPPLPKFKLETHVKCRNESGCSLTGNMAVVVGSKYVSNECWAGWTYKLTNNDLIEPVEIREIWLELAPTNTEATDKRPVSK